MSTAAGTDVAFETNQLFDALMETMLSTAFDTSGRSTSTLQRSVLGSVSLPDVTSRDAAQLLQRIVAHIDELISQQVNAILHHPRLQRLEASWRGVQMLVEQIELQDESSDKLRVEVRLLSLPWRELEQDLRGALEFDQSRVFDRIYSDEFDMPGGTPYGLLIGDYEIQQRPDHLWVLESVAQVAAAAFAPFVTAADPSLFGIEDFGQLTQPRNLQDWFAQPEFIRWREFRKSDDARFVGLVLPRIQMRLPYGDDVQRNDGFVFQEEIDSPESRLWGNAAYSLGAVAIRAFQSSSWLAEIVGVRQGEAAGGLVDCLPVEDFETDAVGIAPKGSTEVLLNEFQDRELSQLGFVPLCDCPDTPYSAFYSVHSLQEAKKFTTASASTNAEMSSLLHYTLCVSRFAHLIKVIGRDKLGNFTDAQAFEDELHRWLNTFVTDSSASDEIKAEKPLSAAQVKVYDDGAGSFRCVMHLQPHYQFDDMVGSLQLSTTLEPLRLTVRKS